MKISLSRKLINKTKMKYKNIVGTIEEIENTVRYLINTEYVSGCAMKVNGGLDF